MAGGGHIIIRSSVAKAADLGSIKDQLGPLKRAKLDSILFKPSHQWRSKEFKFVMNAIHDAHDAYDEED